jgi:hypothetical protein
MSVTPTGNLSLPLHQLRNVLIVSTAWQTWAGSVPLAAANVYLTAAPARAANPHIIIDWDSDLTRSHDGIRGARFPQTGSLLLYFCASVTANQSWIDAMTEFCNNVDAVMADVETITQDGGQGLVVDSYNLTAGPARIPALERDRHGDLMEALFSIRTRGWR